MMDTDRVPLVAAPAPTTVPVAAGSPWHAWRAWWRALPDNPVYLREQGHWGRPSSTYEAVRRYAPLIVAGGLVLGLIGAIAHITTYTATSGMVAVVVCLITVPLIITNTLTFIGAVLAPALTAPSISREISGRTWELLNTIPQSTASIVLAKLFGALARLKRLFQVVFFLALVEAFILMFITFAATAGRSDSWGVTLLLAAVTFAGALRPPLELAAAALIGMYASTRATALSGALAGAYTGIVLLRVFASGILWSSLGSAAGVGDTGLVLLLNLVPTTVYLLLLPTLLHRIVKHADTIFEYAR